MDVKQVWINLPVKDISRSRKFFSDIGFRENPRHKDNENMAGFLLGKDDFVMMLFPEEQFEGFSGSRISDTQKGAEFLMNIDAQSRKEVDEFAQRVRNAGGEIFAEPAESQGWMYAFGFMDPDGHRWSMLHMDMSQAPE